MNNPRIVFMGTPEFAVSTLGSLLINGFNVVSVVTVPDKPAGRGQKITRSAVKEFAEFSQLPILQPVNLRDPDFINTLRSLNAELFIVVAFRMLPKEVWQLPELGTINLHASLLPDYRGAAPINRAIMNGETVTGITTFLIDEKIDTGRILFREEIPIFPYENAGDLHDRMMKLGARLVIKTINALSNKSVTPVAQSDLLTNDSGKIAPKIHPEDCIINWNDDVNKIHNKIRGLSPYPCAKSWFEEDKTSISFKIFESQPIVEPHNLKTATIVTDHRNFLKVACPGGYISILNLQTEGKKRMGIADFLRGFRIGEYTIRVS